ncbi:hypothetical protein AB0C59_02805 [Streptomyces sp. NPDC048664]|uniref:hypothetical protein n=1 Tax=Streptomyces sp. NPDC048664 TaxID=3154505 RepID=UPI00341C1C8B
MYLTPHGKTQSEQSNHPIFVERSGKRRKVLRYTAVALGGACGAYLVFAAVVMAGLWQSLGHQPSGTGGTIPAAPAGHHVQPGAAKGSGSGRQPVPPPADASSHPRGGTPSPDPDEVARG